MRTALAVLLFCAAVDLALCAILLAIVWSQHRTMRREAAAIGEEIPSAGRQLGCLLAYMILGLVGVYATAWFLLRD